MKKVVNKNRRISLKDRIRKYISYIPKIRKQPKLVLDYFQGEFRQFCYDYNIPLVRAKIVREYEYRCTETPAKDCVANGECLCCGCESPAVHFCNKGCSVNELNCEQFDLKQCYPPMGILDFSKNK